MTMTKLVADLTARPFSRIVLIVTIIMTWRITVWAFEFAHAMAGHNGMETAAIIAAITVPFTALQGFAFSTYTSGK
jgi:uncharacterized membrane protein YphA (DoxX/SURF4 family)